MEKKLLKHWLWACWDKETAHSLVKENWSKENRAIWQCAITAMLVKEILWWDILKAYVSNYWFSHFWNLIDGKEIDFTYDQFTNWEPIFENKKIANFDKLKSNEDTNNRFKILKEKFTIFLDKYQECELNISKCRLCKDVFYFEHKSIYLWDNCSLLFIWEAPAKNGWRVTWKAWKDKNWNIIPSWKVLQKLLDILDIDLFDITFLEAIKCFPENRKILQKLMENCSHILYKQIDLLKPNILITLWDHPTRAFLWKSYKKFQDVVWKEFKIKINDEDYVLIPIYHPSPISPKSLKWNIPIFNKLKSKLWKY